jgi:hypothetical protein
MKTTSGGRKGDSSGPVTTKSSGMKSPLHLIENHLGNWCSGWNMGSFGAIAEFHRDQDEAYALRKNDRLSVATERGGVAFDIGTLSSVRPIAYETLSPKPHRWAHAIALCLPADLAGRHARTTLTELGRDREAVRPDDSDDVLFDLGLSLPQCDFCVRANDHVLLDVLRANVGRPLFEPGNQALGALLAAHPHRVAITNIGRIEVYQKIGGPDTGGVSPEGPHTHLLPKLLKSGRTHSANVPIPAGLVPLGGLHPANPVMNAMGRDQPFDPVVHDAFQILLAEYGLPESVEVKKRVMDAIARGGPPESFTVPADRLSRSAVRLALRQAARRAEFSGDGALLASISMWREAYDGGAGSADDEDDDAPGH